LNVKQTIFASINPSSIRRWKQPVLCNEGKVCCSRKQWDVFDRTQAHDRPIM